MDAIEAVKHAGKIFQLIDIINHASSTIRGIEDSVDVDEDKCHVIDRVVYQIQNHLEAAQYHPSGDTSVLTREEEIFLRLNDSCTEAANLAVRCLRDDAGATTGGEHGMTSSQHREVGEYEMQEMVMQMREELNGGLSQLLRLSISQEFNELGAKNNRLEASRTLDIQKLLADIDLSFQALKQRDFVDDVASGIWTNLLNAVRTARDYSVEQTVLSSLTFWTMDRRKQSLPKEHEKTFGWMLEDTSLDDHLTPAISFTEWLRSDEKLYWVSGKPGSGKSTLMHYVAESAETMKKLRKWAGDHELITASFYFWSSAKDPLQKSDVGLLRSILFQVLRQCPDLIREAFSDLWRERSSQSSLRLFAQTEWSTDELLSAYQRISGLLSATKVRFCFFVDGLDEFDGNPNDIIRLIESLSKIDGIKTCVSSRQWPQFEKIFGGSNPWRLYVHELTRSDMEIYATDLLSNDSKVARLSTGPRNLNLQPLVDALVRHAQGVFLWVFLVVRSLLDCMQETDSIEDLQRRLANTPSDLEQYFDQIMLQIDMSMRQQTAHMFEMTLEAVEKLPLICYNLIRDDESLDLSSAQVRTLWKEGASERLQLTAQQLNSYSRGLLKAIDMSEDYQVPPDLEEHTWLFGFRVDFLHRTIGDYLRTANMRKLLRDWSTHSFDVDMTICKASLATVKLTSARAEMFNEPSRALSMLHLFLAHAGNLDQGAQSTFTDELLASLRGTAQSIPGLMAMILGPGNYWALESSFEFAILYHLVSYGLVDYVARRLNREMSSFQEPRSALLSGCFSWDPRVRMGSFNVNFGTAQALLQMGLDPNVAWGDRNFTFWQSILNSIYSKHLKGLVSQSDCDTIKIALDHGADPQASLEVFAGRRLTEMKAIEIVEKVLPKEQSAVLQVAKEW